MTLRALVIHNFYRSENASGENLSVRDEIDGLREYGWDVEVISADSDVIGSGAIPLHDLALRPIYSRRSVNRVREATRRFRPHVALVENLFPLHSPWVIKVLRQAGVPVAAGVRSYRMMCVRSTLYRNSAPCRECLASSFNIPAVRNRCYQDSTLRSVPMAASLRIHRPTFLAVDALLAVSEFVRDELIDAGFDADRIVVRPNFVGDPGHVDGDFGEGFLFAGRLTDDKGVAPMLDGWIRSEAWHSSRLLVAGSGPLAAAVEGMDPRHRVEALGLLAHDEVLELIPRTAVTVVPSMWPEPFGRGVIEAAARSRPSLVTDAGGMASLVVDGETGWIADASVAGLAEAFRRAVDVDDQQRFGEAARRRFEQCYTRAASLDVLDETLRRVAEQGIGLEER